MQLHNSIVSIVFLIVIAGAVLGFKLTNEPRINSNLNSQQKISGELLKRQVSDIYFTVISPIHLAIWMVGSCFVIAMENVPDRIA